MGALYSPSLHTMRYNDGPLSKKIYRSYRGFSWPTETNRFGDEGGAGVEGKSPGVIRTGSVLGEVA